MRKLKDIVCYRVDGIIFHIQELRKVFINSKTCLNIDINHCNRQCKSNYLNDKERYRIKFQLDNLHNQLEEIESKIKYLDELLRLYNNIGTNQNCSIRFIYPKPND